VLNDSIEEIKIFLKSIDKKEPIEN